jgi:hypothetical protein
LIWNRTGTEGTHDESSIAMRGAIEIGLVGSSHFVASDENAVRMGMPVQIHVLRSLNVAFIRMRFTVR